MSKALGIICGIFALWIAVGTVNASAMTMDELFARMEESDRKVTGISFSFSQDIVVTLTKEKQRNTGEVVFQKPGNLHIRQSNPLEQVIVSNGKKVWIYTPSYEQVIVDSWKKWMESSMVPPSILNFGGSWKELKGKYGFAYAGLEDGRHVVVLTPHDKGSWQMKLWIEPQDFVPVKAALYGDNVTVITETSNVKLNPSIDRNMFTFKAPKGVEVLQLPQ